jgi:hypothetical protein
VDDESEAGDVVELGERRWRPPRWRPSRAVWSLAAAAAVVGLVAGYTAGFQHGRASTAPRRTVSARASASSATTGPAASFIFARSAALSQDAGACSAQTGLDLQLGIEVTNQSVVPVTLRTAGAVAPRGVFRQVAQQWAPCGEVAGPLTAGPAVLLPGATTWLTVTLQVKVGCPAAYPVQFTVGYLAQGRPGEEGLSGFTDLGHVSYSGCPAA